MRSGRTNDLALLGVALVCAIVDVALLLWALILGFHIEGTTEAIADADRGQGIALAAVPALAASIVALRRRRGRVRSVALIISVLATAGAITFGLLR